MILPHQILTSALRKEYLQMLPMLADAGTQASGAVAAQTAIELLTQRAARGSAGLRDQARAMGQAARSLGLEAICADLDAFSPVNLEQGEVDLRALTQRFESAVRDMTDSGAPASVAVLAAWEAASLRSEMPAAAVTETIDTVLTRDKLEIYLRDRFDDPGLEVTAFRPLPGGFGKETTLFSVSGKAIEGEFVLRRDPGDNQSLANDCHEIAREYPVIRAVFGRGFPAPDALWLDTSHALLPGGHFIVMRKSPGELGGSFFGATTTIAPHLAETLAGITAMLHRLPPLDELGDLASFIKPELWSLSRGMAARRYITEWRAYYLTEAHSPSPALMAIYAWLLANVPDRPEPASLNHGDIGFNNFLFEEGRLSAVLDWEFAHIGDPAEDLGYIAITTGNALDWKQFMAAYIAAGGDPVEAETLHFFKIWAFARNASASNILWTRFSDGLIDDVKLCILPYFHYPLFIEGAARLIAEGPQAD